MNQINNNYTGVKIMKSRVIILLFLFCTFNVFANNETDSDLRQEIKSWEIILKGILPPDLKHIHIVTEEDIKIYRTFAKNESSGNLLYEAQLKAYKSGRFLSFLKGDFNKNGREDIAFACIDTNNESSYLIIIEKEENKYKLVEKLKIQASVFFIGGIYEDKLMIAFQADTDWIWLVSWNGNKFIVEED
jgi:hypothetical protein